MSSYGRSISCKPEEASAADQKEERIVIERKLNLQRWKESPNEGEKAQQRNGLWAGCVRLCWWKRFSGGDRPFLGRKKIHSPFSYIFDKFQGIYGMNEVAECFNRVGRSIFSKKKGGFNCFSLTEDCDYGDGRVFWGRIGGGNRLLFLVCGYKIRFYGMEITVTFTRFYGLSAHIESHFCFRFLTPKS